MLESPEDVKLNYFEQISPWLLDELHSCPKELHVRKQVPTNDNISFESKAEDFNATKYRNESCEDHFFTF